jgi:hypothetical protein
VSARTYRVVATPDAPLVIGRHVTGSSIGYHRGSGRVAFRSTWSGIYQGVHESQHDPGQYVHLFMDGDVNGIPQTSHGFPVDQAVEVEVREVRSVVVAVEDEQGNLHVDAAAFNRALGVSL